MKCRYCYKTLAPLRSLTDGQFCCDEHRSAFEWEASKIGAPIEHEKEADTPAAAGPSQHLSQRDLSDHSLDEHNLEPVESLRSVEHGFEPEFSPAARNAGVPGAQFAAGLPEGDSHAFPSEASPAGIGFGGRSLSEEGDEAAPREDWEPLRVRFHPLAQLGNTWQWLKAVWKTAPFELKVITLLLPVLLGVAVTPTTPRIEIAVPAENASENKVRKMLDQRWKVLEQNISSRKAVAYTDDFRSGLDAWNSHSKLTKTWAYDAAGFVEPGPLAIFKPTAEMSDYRFEYLGEIDRRAMGFAFRAKNLDNYYAVKFVIVQPGPLPVVHILRYAVINGKAGPRVEKPLPVTSRADMFYRVAVDVRGGDFTILVQGQVVDFWSDDRLQQGGVGFFCDRGERARLRWVEVTHQYDTLGKLCAFLAPYGGEESN